MSTTVRVDEDTHERLQKLKREDETLNDVISRLIEERREEVVEGAGYWEGSDAVQEAQNARKSMKDDVGQDAIRQ